MAKQMMQDILINNKDEGDGTKEIPKEAVQRRVAPPPSSADEFRMAESVPKEALAEDSFEAPLPKIKEAKPRKEPMPSSLEDSPIFEKMKKHNKDRESFSDEFVADKKSGGGRFLGKTLLVLVALLLVGGFLYGLFFYDAVLTITPKHADVTLQNTEFTAGGTPPAGGGDVLAFQSMTVSAEDSSQLTATGEKNIISKSAGQIVVYNDFGPQSQALIKNTRFQSPDGKIYRIHDSIVVPGQKTVNGKKVPGSLEVSVSADAAGPEYNIGLVDFTIPGFKSSPRYEKIYARSKTPMSGGFSGPTKIVSPGDIQTAKDTIIAGLKTKLFADAVAQKPKGTVLYKDAVAYDFTDSMDDSAGAAGGDNKSVKLTVRGSLTATLFNAEDLSKHIVKSGAIPADVSPNDHILVSNLEDLVFAAKSESGGASSTAPKEGDTYVFSLNGEAHAMWQIDTAALASKLAGVKKADYKNVFADFPGIEKANATIRPFWKTKFPTDAAKIRIEIAQP